MSFFSLKWIGLTSWVKKCFQGESAQENYKYEMISITIYSGALITEKLKDKGWIPFLVK